MFESGFEQKRFASMGGNPQVLQDTLGIASIGPAHPPPAGTRIQINEGDMESCSQVTQNMQAT